MNRCREWGPSFQCPGLLKSCKSLSVTHLQLTEKTSSENRKILHVVFFDLFLSSFTKPQENLCLAECNILAKDPNYLYEFKRMKKQGKKICAMDYKREKLCQSQRERNVYQVTFFNSSLPIFYISLPWKLEQKSTFQSNLKIQCQRHKNQNGLHGSSGTCLLIVGSLLPLFPMQLFLKSGPVYNLFLK